MNGLHERGATMAKVFKTHLKTLMLTKAVEVGQVVTQKMVAEATGMSLPAVGRWYAGEIERIEGESTWRLLDYFQCGLCDLVEIVDSSK